MRNNKNKMRNEKFIPEETSDDIKYAFDNNGIGSRLADIDVIVAQVCGENDGYNWYWILKMKDGSFSLAEGGCDYTGWDCQSHATIHDGYKSADEAIQAVEVSKFDSRKSIKKVLSKQVTGEIPYAIYQEI